MHSRCDLKNKSAARKTGGHARAAVALLAGTLAGGVSLAAMRSNTPSTAPVGEEPVGAPTDEEPVAAAAESDGTLHLASAEAMPARAVSPESPIEEEESPGRFLSLRVPTRPRLTTPPPPLRGDWTQFALAYQYETRVFAEPKAGATFIGTIRRGRHVGVLEQVQGSGCSKGIWYRLATGGFGCSTDGVLVAAEKKPFWIRQIEASIDRPLPYDYAKIKNRDALRFYRPLEAKELAEIARLSAQAKKTGTPAKYPDVVETVMDGDYLVALDREEEHHGRRYYRTVNGRYVFAEEVDPKTEPAMHGVWLDGDLRLPIAFVHALEGAPILRRTGSGKSGKASKTGDAVKHARFGLLKETRWGDTAVAVGPGGFAIPRDTVRIARRRARPEGVGPSEKWIHIDIPEQTLVAYEGNKPVFVTLVSTGRDHDGYVTPTGLYRVQHKHISTTMSGNDPKEGVYQVEEVPWTLFYQESFAVHGAYWHDNFGNKKSHGCTNVAPADARWLFYWSTPGLPAEWHSTRKEPGTHVYLTNDQPG